MDNRHTQLLKGALDICLLALIAQRPCYGYEMVERLTQHGLELVSEGSIYPLLSRLQQQGYIESYFIQSTEGPKRKYYRLLPAGAQEFKRWRQEWFTFSNAVEQILRGEATNDNDTTTRTRNFRTGSGL